MTSTQEDDNRQKDDLVAAYLEKCTELTTMMRQHQQAVQRIGEHRRVVIRSLRQNGCPYRTIAMACGVTDQALYADLRKHPE